MAICVSGTCLCHALTGLNSLCDLTPWRCHGLVCLALSGQEHDLAELHLWGQAGAPPRTGRDVCRSASENAQNQPVKVGSPLDETRGATESNCVAVRRAGKQLEVDL